MPRSSRRPGDGVDDRGDRLFTGQEHRWRGLAPRWPGSAGHGPRIAARQAVVVGGRFVTWPLWTATTEQGGEAVGPPRPVLPAPIRRSPPQRAAVQVVPKTAVFNRSPLGTRPGLGDRRADRRGGADRPLAMQAHATTLSKTVEILSFSSREQGRHPLPCICRVIPASFLNRTWCSKKVRYRTVSFRWWYLTAPTRLVSPFEPPCSLRPEAVVFLVPSS